MTPIIDPFAYDSAIPRFVCGLCWLAGAMLLVRKGFPKTWRTPRSWLGLTVVAQALENWLQIALLRGGHPPLFAWLCSGLSAISALAMVEYSARRFQRPPIGAPGRWVYVPLAIWTAFCFCYLPGAWLDLGYRAIFAWGVIALAWRKIVGGRWSKAGTWQMLSALGLAGYSVAACFQWTALDALLALMTLLSVWGGQQRAGDPTCDADAGRPYKKWRRWATPAAFSIATGVGCLLLGSGEIASPEDVAISAESNYEQLFAELEAEPAPSAEDDFEQQLKRCGTAAAPILGLVLAVWGLSRLPFAR